MMWSPVLEGNELAAARIWVERLVALLWPDDHEGLPEPGLFGGRAGARVARTYLAAARNGPIPPVDAYFEEAGEAMATASLGANLAKGLFGIGWAAGHLDRAFGERVLDDDAFEEVDERALEAIAEADSRRVGDLMVGAVGIGVFALERLPSEAARRVLGAVVRRLDALKATSPSGACWWRSNEDLPPEAKKLYPSGVAFTGIAHGMTGAMAILAVAIDEGVEVDVARPLFEAAWSWLRSIRLPASDAATYPEGVKGSVLEPQPYGRGPNNGWCSGDPGLTLTLFLASRRLGDAERAEEVLVAARRAAARRDEARRSRCLCHGHASRAHLFQRLYHATKEDVFRDAARHWFRVLLEDLERSPPMLVPAGQPNPDLEFDEHGREGRSLLWGTAGVLLALLAATTEQEPAWDRSMLMSLPPRSR